MNQAEWEKVLKKLAPELNNEHNRYHLATKLWSGEDSYTIEALALLKKHKFPVEQKLLNVFIKTSEQSPNLVSIIEELIENKTLSFDTLCYEINRRWRGDLEQLQSDLEPIKPSGVKRGRNFYSVDSSSPENEQKGLALDSSSTGKTPSQASTCDLALQTSSDETQLASSGSSTLSPQLRLAPSALTTEIRTRPYTLVNEVIDEPVFSVRRERSATV